MVSVCLSPTLIYPTCGYWHRLISVLVRHEANCYWKWRKINNIGLVSLVLFLSHFPFFRRIWSTVPVRSSIRVIIRSSFFEKNVYSNCKIDTRKSSKLRKSSKWDRKTVHTPQINRRETRPKSEYGKKGEVLRVLYPSCSVRFVSHH